MVETLSNPQLVKDSDRPVTEKEEVDGGPTDSSEEHNHSPGDSDCMQSLQASNQVGLKSDTAQKSRDSVIGVDHGVEQTDAREPGNSNTRKGSKKDVDLLNKDSSSRTKR